MLFSALLGATALCSIVPAALFFINLRRFRPPAPVQADQTFPVSVLIPARNEEANIGEALRSVLASHNVDLQVVVWDDDSTDQTAEIVQALACHDPRIRLLHGTGLPPGWNGKQHACWQLAHAASRSILVFLDADVRVDPDLLARMAAFRANTGAGLVSGFPRLLTVTWLEKLLLPLIHFILLAFLPMRAMRQRAWPSAAAGCGQFLLTDRDAYFAAGGHNAIRETMHDGLLLPRIFRHAGYKTDIADITRLAHVRMYDSAAKVWQGLAKNATEGIATPAKILPLSLILLLGQVLPVPLLVAYLLLLQIAHTGAGMSGSKTWTATEAGILLLLMAAVLGSFLPRFLAIRRFRQPLSSSLLHPLGILCLLILQWYALARKVVGRPVGWRQRTYSSQTGTQVGS